MSLPIRELDELIRSMEPVLNDGVYAFISVKDEIPLNATKVIASIQETEGFSAIISEADAMTLGLPILFRAAWITLNVHSDLQVVGLTAAFSASLAKEGISCNVVAGAIHDHLFVPVERAAEAMKVLIHLQKSASPK